MIRHWNAWDEGKRSHLFVADANTGEATRPDAQARGQHAPCPVRRLVRLCLVARRQGAGLHGRAGQGPGLVHQHRHLDRPGRRRRAQEPDRGQPGRRRPARLLARRHDGSPTSARRGRASSRICGSCAPGSGMAARRSTSAPTLTGRCSRSPGEAQTPWPPSSTVRGPSRSSPSGSSSPRKIAIG